MKKIITLLIFLFSINCIIAQSDVIKKQQFKLEGKLINNTLLSPHCGIFAFAVMLEFEIIEYSDKTYTKKSIGVLFPCPEFHGDFFFENGKTYNIVISNTNEDNFKWTIFNPELLTKYKSKLWAIDVKKEVK